MGAGIIEPHKWLWLHPPQDLSEVSPSPGWPSRSPPWWILEEGGRPAGRHCGSQVLCALLLSLFSLSWGRVRAARARCRREPGTAPTPQLVGRSMWEPEVWSGRTRVCMRAWCGRGGVATGRRAHRGVQGMHSVSVEVGYPRSKPGLEQTCDVHFLGGSESPYHPPHSVPTPIALSSRVHPSPSPFPIIIIPY